MLKQTVVMAALLATSIMGCATAQTPVALATVA